MMIKDLVNEAALEYILKDIEITCRRLGVNAKFSININEDYKGEPFTTIVSTSFQTMPMLFKDIHIEGTVRAKSCTDCVQVIFNLEYRVQTFENGYYGFSFGRMIYEVNNGFNSRRPENAHFYIDKVKSINIQFNNIIGDT